MSRKQALILIGAIVLVGLAVAAALWMRQQPPDSQTAGREPTFRTNDPALTGSVTLYFPGNDGRLHSEVRALDTDARGAELAERIVTGVLSGPDNRSLYPPLPTTTTVASAVLADDGTLYLDLASSEHPLPPVSGSQRELLAAYSLVNSVCTNVPGIRGVALLWNGEQRTTFAGNLDTTRPLTPDQRWVRADS